MIKVYIGKLLEWKYLPVLYPNLGFKAKAKHLFINNAFEYLTEPVFTLVDDAADADYLLIPHDYFEICQRETEYLKQFTDLSLKYNKRIIIFCHSDPDEAINIPRSIVFRISQYGYKKSANDVMMPSYAEDLLHENPLSFRPKHDRKPVIGFCGWANLTTARERAGYYARLLLFCTRPPVHRNGIWFRKRAIKILQKSPEVETNFLIRDSFSGHQATIKLNPATARREYIDNMLNSDLALAVKGGGNCSLRFFEALSLGRVPLLLNTDCILPLADIINYKEFVLFVDYKELDKIDVIASDFYKRLSADDWLAIQAKARAAFVNYLRIDSFFKQIPDILKKFYG